MNGVNFPIGHCFFFQESLRLKLVHFGNLTSIGCLNDIFLQVLFNIY